MFSQQINKVNYINRVVKQFAHPAPSTLQAISWELEEARPEEVLEWAVRTYGSSLAMATAFGAEGCVLLDMLSKLGPIAQEVRIFNLDTGYQFDETLQMVDRIKDRYGLNVELVRAKETVSEMENRFGGPIYGTNPDECCHIRKVVPLKETLEGHAAWLSAIRRDQTNARAAHGMVEWDGKFGLVKISPLAQWTRDEVWAYIEANDVPFNPLHKLGFMSIGCYPCTRPVAEGEHERAGRWAGHNKTECGLHRRD